MSLSFNELCRDNYPYPFCFRCLDRNAKPTSLTLPKESRKDNFTDDDFHGGPAWFFSDDPFATQGGARAIPQPPPEADVAGELHAHGINPSDNNGVESHTEIINEHGKNELVDLGNEHGAHDPTLHNGGLVPMH